MADFDVIADASRTLETVLTNALSSLTPAPPPVARLHDLQTQPPNSPAHLTIFLFEIIEDASMRNRPPVRSVTGTNISESKPPMALLLKYLLTPWSGDAATDHQILGRAMQVLYDGAILSGPQLQGSLAGSDQALKLKLEPLTLEERARVWYSVQRPYRLSVTYEVRVVNVDAISSQLKPPVRERVLDSARPEVTS